jgi:hypothetical protein
MTLRQFAHGCVHMLKHAATVFVGLALAVLGLGLTFTGVFTIVGIVLLCIGVGLLVSGIWAHQLAAPF